MQAPGTIATSGSILLLSGLLLGCAHNHQSGLGTIGSASETGRGGDAGTADTSFAREACQTDAAQMEIGALAASNTRNTAVRRFAKELADDHAQAEKELSRLYSSKGLPPEQELTQDLRSSVEGLAPLKGGAFDAAFKEAVVAGEGRTIALFEQEADRGTDPDLKAFAQKYLPRWRKYLETARGLPVSSDTDGPMGKSSPNPVLRNMIHQPIGIPR